MKLIRLVALVFVGACGTSAALAAEPLRLEEAVSRALAAHPSITAETAQLQAVRARTQREALPPPYTIGGEMENVAGNGNLRVFVRLKRHCASAELSNSAASARLVKH
ncbi:hypothetical protein P4119_34145 [Pseudomonas aeruginosa]|nr:hypothetical protein [Pseudomonas aeruginosa]